MVCCALNYIMSFCKCDQTFIPRPGAAQCPLLPEFQIAFFQIPFSSAYLGWLSVTWSPPCRRRAKWPPSACSPSPSWSERSRISCPPSPGLTSSLLSATEGLCSSQFTERDQVSLSGFNLDLSSAVIWSNSVESVICLSAMGR